jgi:inner membrane transporter RhtA
MVIGVENLGPTLSEPITQSRASATLMMLGSIFSVQLGASIAKQLFPVVGARGVTALRLGLAALILCAVHRPWKHRLAQKERPFIVAYGIILGVMNLSFYQALARIPLGIAVALEFTGPLSVAILSSHRAIDFLWAMLAVIGILFLLPLTSLMTPLDTVGVAYAFGAGVCWGLYIIVGQRAGSTTPSGVVTAWGMLVGTCVAIPIGLVHPPRVLWTGSIFGMAILVALLSSAIPYSLEMMALKRLPAKTFSIFLSLEPAVAAVLGLMLLHEYLAPLQWIAICCVIVASIGSTATATPKAVQV